MRAKLAKYHVEVEQPAPPIHQPVSQPPTMGFPPIPMVRPGMAPMAPPVGMMPPRMPPQGETYLSASVGVGVDMDVVCKSGIGSMSLEFMQSLDMTIFNNLVKAHSYVMNNKFFNLSYMFCSETPLLFMNIIDGTLI